jgi:hypothetical protein
MNSSPGLRKIEIALIELEYAAADFCHWKSSTTGPGDLAALISKPTKHLIFAHLFTPQDDVHITDGVPMPICHMVRIFNKLGVNL